MRRGQQINLSPELLIFPVKVVFGLEGSCLNVAKEEGEESKQQKKPQKISEAG